jgi:hypothetical protein
MKLGHYSFPTIYFVVPLSAVKPLWEGAGLMDFIHQFDLYSYGPRKYSKIGIDAGWLWAFGLEGVGGVAYIARLFLSTGERGIDEHRGLH